MTALLGNLWICEARRLERIQNLLARRPIWVESALCVFLFALGVAVRLPYLQLVPIYWDEGAEVIWALDISRGLRLPLTGVDSYYGPLFYYLIAGLFKIFAVSAELPRFVAAVFGGLTVVASYWLGRTMYGKWAGLTTAALTVTCPMLVIFSGHEGWSNALTPFFVAATLAVFHSALQSRRKLLWALSGLLAGFMLQSHPVTVVILPGILLWFLIRRDLLSQLKQWGPYLALSFFLIGYSPVIIDNVVRPDLPILKLAVTRTYAFVPTNDPAVYLKRFSDLSQSFLAILTRQFPSAKWLVGGTLSNYLSMFSNLLVLLFALGMLAAIWRRNSLLIFTLLSSFTCFPLFMTATALWRYYSFLGILYYVAIAGFAWVSVRFSIGAGKCRQALRRAYIGVMAVVILVLVTYPVIFIQSFYVSATRNDKTNSDYFLFRDAIRKRNACSEWLGMEDLGQTIRDVKGADWSASLTVQSLLKLDSCSYLFGARDKVLKELGQRKAGWLIILDQSVPTFSDKFVLDKVTFLPDGQTTTYIPFGLYHAIARQ